MGSVRELFTKEYMARLETLSLRISGKVNMGFTGARKSAAKGNSLEFADFRDYVPGDDLRRVDWNSFGRFDKLYMKLFTEEKQAVINIFLDKSKSMDFGEPDKFSYARRVAATIAYLAVKNADRVNVFCCDDALSVRKTNMATKNLFAQLVDFLDGLPPDGHTNLCQAVKETGGINLGQGASVIISDFFSSDGYQEAVKFLQNKKQHVNLIHVLDSSEFDPKEIERSNALRLIDAESGDVLDVFVDPGVLKAYRAAFVNYQSEIKAFCEKRNATYTFAPTGANIIKLFI